MLELPKYVILEDKELQRACNSLLSGLKKFKKKDYIEALKEMCYKYTQLTEIFTDNIPTDVTRNYLQMVNEFRDKLKSSSNIYYETVGRFIVVEGCDYVGKTTLIEKFKEESKGQIDAIFTCDPTGTELGEKIKPYMTGLKVDKYTRVLLEYAAKKELVLKVVEPAIEAGILVVSDRYFLSSLIYNSELFSHHKDINEFMEFVNDICIKTLEFYMPDMWIILHEENDVIKERMAAARGEDLDNLELLLKSDLLSAINNKYLFCGKLEDILLPLKNTPIPLSAIISEHYEEEHDKMRIVLENSTDIYDNKSLLNIIQTFI